MEKTMYTCPMHPEVQQDKPGKCPKCRMNLVKQDEKMDYSSMDHKHQHMVQEKKSGLYTCPMDPDVILEKPGNCPKCGMKLVALDASEHEGHEMHGSMELEFKRRFYITLPFVIATMLLSPNIQKWLGFQIDFPDRELVLFLIGTFIFIFGGIPFFKSAKGELLNKNPQMMTLVAFAITVGYTFSVAATFLFPGESLYWEIATLISVFLLGHWLEMRAIRGATGALAELAKLIPPQAHLLKNGKVIDLQTSEIKLNDVVVVKPGEKVPIDGIVIDGESSINESMITGESRPIGKTRGDKVIGGTINQDGSLTIQVSKTGADTAVSQIMKLIQNAQASKPNVQHLADRAASVLFYIAVSVGTLTFISWMFIFPQGAIFAATAAVAVVVVACPHALGLAIPTVTTITSTLGAKNGILIREMKGLEIARKIDYVVFDKTGTLTKGEFGVEEVKRVSSSKLNENELLTLASAVEVKSQHSIAQGIVNEAKKRNIPIAEVTNFKSYPGKGASGEVDNKTILIGNKALLMDSKIQIDEDLMQAKDKTPVYVAIDNSFAGVIYLADIIRSESIEAISKLHVMGLKTAMLTGDTQDVADVVGKKLKLDTVFAQVLPNDKVNKIKELQKKRTYCCDGWGWSQ